MLNWADLGSLLIVFSSAMTGATAAHSQKASGIVVILFAIGGLLLGSLFAFGASKLAYSALARSSSPRGQRETASTIGYGFLYFITPMLALGVACAVTALLTTAVLSLSQ